MTSRPDDPAPYYRAHVFACVNERPAGHKRGSCKERGAEPLRNYMKSRAKELGLGDVLIVVEAYDEKLELASRNLLGVTVLPVSAVDPVSLVRFENVLLTKAAVSEFEEMLG